MKTKAAPSSSYTTLLTPGVDGSQLFGREALVIVSALRSPKEVLSPQLSAHRVRTSTFHRNYVHSGGWQIFSEKKSEVHDLYRLMHLDESAMGWQELLALRCSNLRGSCCTKGRGGKSNDSTVPNERYGHRKLSCCVRSTAPSLTVPLQSQKLCFLDNTGNTQSPEFRRLFSKISYLKRKSIPTMRFLSAKGPKYLFECMILGFGPDLT